MTTSERGQSGWLRNQCIMTAALAGWLAAAGCQDEVIIPLRADQRDDSVHKSDYFNYAIENLDQLPKFGPHEILSKIVSRLNQWAKSDVPQSKWQLDLLIRTLPQEYQSEQLFEDLSRSDYVPYDGAFLREAAILRNLSNRICADVIDDVESARRLFEWTVTNIELDPEVTDPNFHHAQMPWQTIVFGHGQAIDRAWVFTLLARQQDLDVVLLYVDRPGIQGFHGGFWCAGLVTDKKIYLFDPAYGMPIPGDKPGTIATLDQVATNDKLLRQLDREGSPYPIHASDLKDIAVFIEGGRQYLSLRMKNVKTLLSGDQRMVVTAQPSAIEAKLKGIPHLARPRLWPWPYIAERMFAGDAPAGEALKAEMAYFERFVTGSVNPLWAGRLQHFAGHYTTKMEGSERRATDAKPGQRGAKPLYLMSRTMLQRIPKEKLPERLRDRMQQVVKRADVIRRDGTYWLAMVALDEQNYELAIYYLKETRKLEADPNFPADARKRATWLSLARAYEANDQHDLAISHYLAVRGAAENEAHIRARRLAAAAGKTLADYQPATDPAGTDESPGEGNAAAVPAEQTPPEGEVEENASAASENTAEQSEASPDDSPQEAPSPDDDRSGVGKQPTPQE